MPDSPSLYNRIVAYLKGQLSDRQRHDLEKEVMRDAFEEEAFEGLVEAGGEGLETDMASLMERVDARTGRGRKRNLVPWFRIAAGVVLLAGLGSVLYLLLHKPAQEALSVKQAPQAPAETRIPESPTTASPEAHREKERMAPPAPATSVTVPDAMKTEEQETEMVFRSVPVVEEPAPLELKEEEAAGMAAEPKREAAVMASKSRGQAAYRGRVVDSQGEPLPGVNIMIKGTSTGAVTDTDGTFSLPLPDSSAILQASYIGFKPEEVKAARGKTIVMHEDMLALNEVVVVGYGTQKKSDITGAVSTVQLNKEVNTDMAIVTKPVPPGGTLREFKKWVNKQLDPAILRSVKGKQRTTATLTIKSDGSVTDVRVTSVSAVLAAEYKRVILLSPPWQPATRDENPVESTVEIRFVTNTEE